VAEVGHGEPGGGRPDETAERKGALLRFDLTKATLDAVLTTLDRSLRTWARDPELYAVIIDARAGVRRAAQPLAWTAVEAALWKLECFSKPTVTLLGRTPGSLALAVGLAGTHRALSPQGQIAWADASLDALPTIVLRWAGNRGGVPAVLEPAQALASGAATHLIGDADAAAIEAGLADADPVDPLLDLKTVAATVQTEPGQLGVPGDVQAAAAAAARVDLRAAMLARGPADWTLPTREELQSLRLK
jgi:hypothetical protein